MTFLLLISVGDCMLAANQVRRPELNAFVAGKLQCSGASEREQDYRQG